MPYKDQDTVKLFYSIGEVAKMFEVKTSLVRFWEKEFEIIKPQKNKKGNRLFTQDDVDNFYIIYHLVKERGFTLQGAKAKLNQNKSDTINNVEIVKTLNKFREFLLEVKNKI